MTETQRWEFHLAGLDDLSDRERMVLERLAAGETNGRISTGLAVSIKTVETHIAHIYLKLGLFPSAVLHRRVMAAVVVEQDRRRRAGDPRRLSLTAD